MECLLDYNFNEIEKKLTAFGLEKYRAKQVYISLYQGKTFDECTNLSKDTKKLLNENFISQPITILQTRVSTDGTQKYLYKLADNNIIEGVLMKYKYGNTICISTQVGCAMGCSFCASTIGGLIRNLSSGEILGQIIAVNKLIGGGLGDKRKITNVVLMGSGEPLNNYENVAKFLKLVTAPNGFMISERNISLSTCGIVPNIKKLADDGFKVTLTISLHAPTDEIRKSIMKIANVYSIKDILSACRYYYKKTNRRIVFEYILIKDVNTSYDCAVKLSKLVKGLNCHINLIPLNEVEGKNLKAVTKKDTYKFLGSLEKLGVNATVRRTLGSDIEGACGQLKRSFLKNNDEE